ncbi:MAG: sulfite exporter TauE/SafE family protein, partial [Dehalococcoidia bacterium]|nr:sulfite exporter TauE/SafE family protein [Dehalococcoidia bacterium]
ILLLGAGAYVLLQPRAQRPRSRPFGRSALGIGGFAMGFVSGLTGVGGPLIVVPALILLGTPILLAVGVSQVFSLLSSLGGSFGYLLSGTIDYKVMGLILLGELPGVYLGCSMARRTDGRRLRRLLGLLCLVAGAWMLLYLPGT